VQGTSVRIRACRVDELAPGEARRIEGDHQPVAVYNIDGELYALDDTCTHEKFALTEGWIDDDVVECALHMAKFCIRTGKALCLPANRDVATHSVEVVDGEVWIVMTSGGTP
jgi:3-phenylpropionate/trans-cinnamate dioxygenase ferredoxin component